MSYNNSLLQDDTFKLNPKIIKINRRLMLIGMVLLFLGYALYWFFPSSKEEKLSFLGPVVALGGILTWTVARILVLISVNSRPRTKKLVRFRIFSILTIVGLVFIASGLIIVLVAANGNNYPVVPSLLFSTGLAFIFIGAIIDNYL